MWVCLWRVPTEPASIPSQSNPSIDLYHHSATRIRPRRVILDCADQTIWLSKALLVLWVAWEFFTENHTGHACSPIKTDGGTLSHWRLHSHPQSLSPHIFNTSQFTYFGSRWGSGGFPGERRRRRPQVWKDPTSSDLCSLPAFSYLPGKTHLLSFPQEQRYNYSVPKKKTFPQEKFSYGLKLTLFFT